MTALEEVSPAGSGAKQGGPPAKPAFVRRGRILFSLLAVFCLIGLAPLATVAWKLIDINREALKTSHQEYQLLMASGVAREVDLQTEAIGSRISASARALGGLLGRGDGADDATIRRVLEEVTDDRLLYLRFTDLRGRVVDTESTATVPPDLVPLFVAGLREAVEKTATVHGDAPPAVSVSAPILLAGSPPRAAAIFSTPVVALGSFRGVLCGLVDLQTVWDAVVGGNRTGHTIFAVDSRGVLFAINDRAGVRAASRELVGSEIVRRYVNAPRRSRETMPYELVVGGRRERYLGSYEVTRQGWGIFVQAKERQVYLPVVVMVESTLSWAALALGLAVIAAIVLAGTLSRPIDRLAAAARAFAAGDLRHRVSVRSRNEIGELAHAFNRMAAQIEDSIERLRKAAEENNALFLGTIRALAQAIDAKDPYTRGHSMRVNRYSVILARHLGLSREQVADIHVASLLHDIGKIGVDDAILKKPSQLNSEEFAIMRTHAERGASIMAPIRQMKRILPGLRSHHERWQGGGYPDGLAGEDIPLMARIIAAADAFDAMTTDRPYQAACDFESALRRLNELKGVGLDEKVVEAFNRAYQAGDFRREEQVSAPPREAVPV